MINRDKRLAIGKDVYDNNLSYKEASLKYEVSISSIRDYYKLYLKENNINSNKRYSYSKDNFKDYEDMTKEELIDELIKARVETERAKKGYMVKGGGQEKEFISLKEVNSK